MIAQRAAFFKAFDVCFATKNYARPTSVDKCAQNAHIAQKRDFGQVIHILIHTKGGLSTPKYAKIHFFTPRCKTQKRRFPHTDMQNRTRRDFSTSQPFRYAKIALDGRRHTPLSPKNFSIALKQRLLSLRKGTKSIKSWNMPPYSVTSACAPSRLAASATA